MMSYARGYSNLWTPVVGQVPLLKSEGQTIAKNRYVVAIVYAYEVVGHVPYKLVKSVSQFLLKNASKGLQQ